MIWQIYTTWEKPDVSQYLRLSYLNINTLRLFRVEGDKKSQYLDAARLSEKFMQAKCIKEYDFSRRSGRAHSHHFFH
jgi:hypothetical protein